MISVRRRSTRFNVAATSGFQSKRISVAKLIEKNASANPCERKSGFLCAPNNRNCLQFSVLCFLKNGRNVDAV